MTRARNINPSLRHLLEEDCRASQKLVSKSMDDYHCCEVGNHPSTNQDEHSLGLLQIQDQNGQKSTKPHYPQDGT
jgi:hypothetical protein